jgi:hypothetical protein
MKFIKKYRKQLTTMILSFLLIIIPFEQNLVQAKTNNKQIISESLKAKIESGDMIISKRARSKNSVFIIKNPEKYDAGLAPIVIGFIVAGALATYAIEMKKQHVENLKQKYLKLANQINEAYEKDTNNVTSFYEAGKEITKDYLIEIGPEVAKKYLGHEAPKIASIASEVLGSDITPKMVGEALSESFSFLSKGLDAVDVIFSILQFKEFMDLSDQENKLEIEIKKLEGLSSEQNKNININIAKKNDIEINYSQLILNNEFKDLSNWEYKNAFTTSHFGPITADPNMSFDKIFAVVHTGLGESSNQGYLEQSINIPMSRNATFSMLYNFVTCEYPQWYGSKFNDNVKVKIVGPSGDLILDFSKELNSSSFSFVNGLPGDVLDHTWGGQTGWLLFTKDLLFKNGIYKLRIEVNDVSDNIFDSAVLVDRVGLGGISRSGGGGGAR